MDLLDLEPHVRFRRLPHTPEAEDWAFEVKRAAMGPHIEVRWGWDERLQRQIHHQRFTSKPFLVIERSGERLGTLSLQKMPDHIQFGEFYLLPQHQKQGLGSAIVLHCLAIADQLGVPVRLEYLHWNPVGSLYRRHGFTEVGRSEIHFYMERPARGQVS